MCRSGYGEVQSEGEDENGEGLNIKVKVAMAKKVCRDESYESEEGEGMLFL